MRLLGARTHEVVASSVVAQADDDAKVVDCRSTEQMSPDGLSSRQALLGAKILMEFIDR